MVKNLNSPRPGKYVTAVGGFLLLIMLLTLFTGAAAADVAPPQAPPGANPQVETVQTDVRMMEEIVVIDIQDETDLSRMGTARVWAEFQMKNLGTSTERLLVRFPISYNDGWGQYPEIQDLSVYVNDELVETEKIVLDGEPDQWNDPIGWTEFEVTFPPNQDLEIEVDYTLNGTGEYPFVSYGYLLETGAGWRGTIGSAEITVRLPYSVEPANLFLQGSPGWGGTTPGAVVDKNQLTWFFEDFEPEREDNISVALVWPSLWNQIIDQRSYVADFPDDGEGWGRLAKLYKEAARLRKELRQDPGGRTLYNWSKEAYQKALMLLPEDPLWHAGYGDLMFWNSLYTYQRSEEGRSEYIEALQQMHTGYLLNPQEEYILDYLDGPAFSNAVQKQGDEYIFLWLTQTPTLMPDRQAAAATETPEPTASPVVLSSATSEPTDPPSAAETRQPAEKELPDPEDASDEGGGFSLPVCGSLIVFPFVLGLSAVSVKFRKQRLVDKGNAH